MDKMENKTLGTELLWRWSEFDEACENEESEVSEYYGEFKTKYKAAKIMHFAFREMTIDSAVYEFDKLISALYNKGFKFKHIRWAIDKEDSKYYSKSNSTFRQIDILALFVFLKSPYFKEVIDEHGFSMAVASYKNFNNSDEAMEYIEKENQFEVDEELKKIIKMGWVDSDFFTDFKPIEKHTKKLKDGEFLPF